MKKILLVEDSREWQQAIRAILKTDSEVELVGIEDNFEGALHLFHKTSPDIIILDWQIIGQKDGLEIGRALMDFGFPASRIILASNAPPETIPPHPFTSLAKSVLLDQLMSKIKEMTVHLA